MDNAPSIHDQFEEIVGFVDDLCRTESKLRLLHAGDQAAPACEESTKPARFAIWEDPAVVASEPLGIPGIDDRGNPSDQFNWCPYCHSHVWVSPATPIGTKLTCYWCRAWFRRAI